MAITKIGAPLAGIRGTIGGTTFSANRSGTYAKGWSRGSNPRSNLQSKERGTFGGLNANWRALTNAERTDWDTYAAAAAQELFNSLGEGFFASGFNWFVRINVHRLSTDKSLRTTFPTATRPSQPTITTFVVNETGSGNAELTFPDADFGGTDQVIVHGYRSNTISRSVAGNVRLWKFSTVDPGTQTLINDELDTIYGSRELARRWFVEMRVQDNQGQRSSPATANTVTV